MIYDIKIPFDKSINKASLEALVRGLEAEYCQIALAIKMKEYNYMQLDINGDQAEEDKKQLEQLDKEVERGLEAMEFHLVNIKYFKELLATYE